MGVRHGLVCHSCVWFEPPLADSFDRPFVQAQAEAGEKAKPSSSIWG